MPIPITDNRKEFEKPKNGPYIGVVVDVVDLGLVVTGFGPKAKIRIVWLLNSKDSEGNYFQVMSQVNASANEKSALYGIVKGILGVVPAPPFDAEILIGKSNQLFVVQEPSADGKKTFANVKVILPLPDGTPPMAIPAGFVRSKDRPKDQPRQAQTQTSAQQAPQQAQSIGNTSVAVADEDIPF